MTSETIRSEQDAARLESLLSGPQHVIVAFSGGVDSSVVAAAAAAANLGSALAVTADSPSVPRWQVELAKTIAAEIGIAHRIISTHEVDDDEYRVNDRDRCFHCKRNLYGELNSIAAMYPDATIVSGTNADDLGDYRPGIEAGRRRGVVTPLADLGIGKTRVRSVARHYRLSNHDLPASPCLASRIAYGVDVTPDRLRRIEQAEHWLRQRGFREFRVRLHQDELARIEVHRVELNRLLRVDASGDLSAHLQDLGFRYVTVDLAGFRSGSMNRVLVSLDVVGRGEDSGGRERGDTLNLPVNDHNDEASDDTDESAADDRGAPDQASTQRETLHDDTSTVSAPTRATSLIGTRIADFQIMRKLGRGGMADVYAARQLSLGRDVAMKVLRHEYARDNDYVQRFRREARAAAKLNHPNIVQVFEVGTVESLHYIAQELVDGENLRQLLDREGAISSAMAVEILISVASALEVASESGITHRDIKPENLMRSSRGIIKVADFGLARFGGNVDATQANLTQAGLTLGTPRYMSPEQVQGKPVDVRSDLYSLGVSMYHLLSGRPPFESDDPLALAVMHLQETPIPLDRARGGHSDGGDLPEWLIAIVSRLLNKLPQDRFQSPSELLAALQSQASTVGLTGFAVGTAAATVRLQRATEKARRDRPRRLLRTVAAIALPLVCTFVAYQQAFRAPGSSVTDLLRPEVEQMQTVRDQYWHAVILRDEAGWKAVGEFFPADENATNAAYVAKSRLQLASLLIDEERYREADVILRNLLGQTNVDRVYQTIALVRRCTVLENLGNNQQLSVVKQRLQGLYADLEANNPSALDVLDRIVPESVWLQFGIDTKATPELN